MAKAHKKVLEIFKQSDLFKTSVSLQKADGYAFSTLFGSIVSILIITVTALYASNKAVILKERSDVNISEYVAKNAISN